MRVLRHILITLAGFALTAEAGSVVPGSCVSALLNRTVSYLAFLPHDYGRQVAAGKRYPVVYLLHCYGCTPSSWFNSPSYCASFADFVDSAEYVYVAPDDGGTWAWWLDSPTIPRSQWSSFLVDELKPHVDSTHATLTDRAFTGVAGHSMGGFGAIHNLIEHPETFSAAYSLMGGLDIVAVNSYGLPTLLGPMPQYLANWVAANPADQGCRLAGKNVSVAFVSGSMDFPAFHAGNARFHRVLDFCGVPHLYNVGVDTANEHYPITAQYVGALVHFFDSVFTAAASGADRPGPHTSVQQAPCGKTARGRSCTITGRSTGTAPGADIGVSVGVPETGKPSRTVKVR